MMIGAGALQMVKKKKKLLSFKREYVVRVVVHSVWKYDWRVWTNKQIEKKEKKKNRMKVEFEQKTIENEKDRGSHIYYTFLKSIFIYQM